MESLLILFLFASVLAVQTAEMPILTKIKSASASASAIGKPQEFTAPTFLNASQRNALLQEMTKIKEDMEMPSLVAAATLGDKVIWGKQ